jgi:hypothetical protein
MVGERQGNSMGCVNPPLTSRVVKGSCIATHNLRANVQNSKWREKEKKRNWRAPKWQLCLPSTFVNHKCHVPLTLSLLIAGSHKCGVRVTLRDITFTPSFILAGQPVLFKQATVATHRRTQGGDIRLFSCCRL